VIILHGLFGSSRNWGTTARELAKFGRLTALDLRNHGSSPHTATHTLEDMVADLERYIDTSASEAPVLMGHSMGGWVAMAYALARPSRVRALVVVDVAPRAYGVDHSREFEALSIDLTGMKRRGEVDRLMAKHISDRQVRQFLQTNLERVDTGFRWRVNVEPLKRGRVVHGDGQFQGCYDGPVLFVVGGRSHYVGEADRARIHALFPRADIEVVAQGDHWLHHTHPEEFQTAVSSFLRGLSEGDR
jgi:pimeloyl-ACP methyl ester carboxylesterase